MTDLFGFFQSDEDNDDSPCGHTEYGFLQEDSPYTSNLDFEDGCDWVDTSNTYYSRYNNSYEDYDLVYSSNMLDDNDYTTSKWVGSLEHDENGYSCEKKDAYMVPLFYYDDTLDDSSRQVLRGNHITSSSDIENEMGASKTSPSYARKKKKNRSLTKNTSRKTSSRVHKRKKKRKSRDLSVPKNSIPESPDVHSLYISDAESNQRVESKRRKKKPASDFACLASEGNLSEYFYECNLNDSNNVNNDQSLNSINYYCDDIETFYDKDTNFNDNERNNLDKNNNNNNSETHCNDQYDNASISMSDSRSNKRRLGTFPKRSINELDHLMGSSNIGNEESTLGVSDGFPIVYVFVAFVKGNPKACSTFSKRTINSIVSLSGEFTHCELVFKMREGFFEKNYVAATIVMGGKVTLEWKEYSYEKWEILQISLSYEESQRCFSYCLKNQGKPFSMNRIAVNYLPSMVSLVLKPLVYFSTLPDGESFFCSELVLEALKASGNRAFVQHHIDPGKTTPSTLYYLLINFKLVQLGDLKGAAEEISMVI